MPIVKRVGKHRVVQALQRAVRETGSLRAWARAHAISAPYVSEVIRGSRDPGPKILASLGYRRVDASTRYEEVA